MCTCCDVLLSVMHLKLETSPLLVNVYRTRHVQHAHTQVGSSSGRRTEVDQSAGEVQHSRENPLDCQTANEENEGQNVCLWGAVSTFSDSSIVTQLAAGLHVQWYSTVATCHPLFDVQAPPLLAPRLRCLHCCASIAPPQQMHLMLRDCSRHWNRAGMRRRP